MHNFFINKRGAEKIFSVWWFLMLAIVGAGVTVGVLIYYSADVDVRQLEADTLYNKLSDCLIEQGFLKEDLFSENFNIFTECHLNPESFAPGGFFYFKISFLDPDGNKLREDIREGIFSYDKDCMQEKPKNGIKLEARYYPQCSYSEENILYSSNSEIKGGVMEILTASNQEGSKIISLP